MTGGPETGGGRLVLVVGPSGAGKDSLIRHARAALAEDGHVVFPRRVVTRPPSPAEDNIEADEAGFAAQAAAGAFAATWTAHGLRYGLPRAIEADLAQGHAVVCNVSRTVVGALRARHPGLVAIAVTAPPDILAARLAARGRDREDPAERLARSSLDGTDAPDVTIVNDGTLEEACAAFLAALRGAIGGRPPRPVASPGPSC